jgi:hypothetical protein
MEMFAKLRKFEEAKGLTKNLILTKEIIGRNSKNK